MMNGAATDASPALKWQKGPSLPDAKRLTQCLLFPFFDVADLPPIKRQTSDGGRGGGTWSVRWGAGRVTVFLSFLSTCVVRGLSEVMWWRSDWTKVDIEWREGGGLFLEYKRLMLSRWELGACKSLVQCAWITINHMLWSWCICIYTHTYVLCLPLHVGEKGHQICLGISLVKMWELAHGIRTGTIKKEVLSLTYCWPDWSQGKTPCYYTVSSQQLDSLKRGEKANTVVTLTKDLIHTQQELQLKFSWFHMKDFCFCAAWDSVSKS